MLHTDYDHKFKDGGEVFQFLKDLKLGVSEVDNKLIIWPPESMDENIRVVIPKSNDGYYWGCILSALTYFYVGIMIQGTNQEGNDRSIDTVAAIETSDAKKIGEVAESLLKDYLNK
jgi:hypothetical protein